jgi:hypothetical protein
MDHASWTFQVNFRPLRTDTVMMWQKDATSQRLSQGQWTIPNTLMQSFPMHPCA